MNCFAIRHENVIAIFDFNPVEFGYAGPLQSCNYWEEENLHDWAPGTVRPEQVSGYKVTTNTYATFSFAGRPAESG